MSFRRCQLLLCPPVKAVYSRNARPSSTCNIFVLSVVRTPLRASPIHPPSSHSCVGGAPACVACVWWCARTITAGGLCVSPVVWSHHPVGDTPWRAAGQADSPRVLFSDTPCTGGLCCVDATVVRRSTHEFEHGVRSVGGGVVWFAGGRADWRGLELVRARRQGPAQGGRAAAGASASSVTGSLPACCSHCTGLVAVASRPA